jgi:hypothetical protein
MSHPKAPEADVARPLLLIVDCYFVVDTTRPGTTPDACRPTRSAVADHWCACPPPREARHWTQETLAERAALDRPHAGIEAGLRNPSVKAMVKSHAD